MVNKTKKIVHLVCTFPPYRGGMGKVALENAKEAASYGYDITVITPKYKYLQDLKAKEEIDGIKIQRIVPFLEIGNAAILTSLFFRLRKFDVYHVHYPFYGVMLFIVLARIIWPKKKLIIHYHMDNYSSGLKNLIFRFVRYFIFPQIIKLADRVIVHSEDYALNCRSSWWLRRATHKMVEIPNGVDTSFYTASESSMNKYNQKNKQLLFVGALDKAHYFKGLEILLEALKDCKQKNWQLNIIGNGDMVDYYKKLAYDFRLDDRVQFNTNCDDNCLLSFYRSSYLTILPSITRGEAFGIVLVESMACRTAVIATNLPGVRSVVVEGKTGELAEPGDIESLRAKLDYLLDQTELVQEYADYGYKRTIKKYSWEAIGKDLDKLYKTL
ncbi:glycosyltransferase family 4 protein [Patescibacteria group bacterium]|nr:glycosyltransferase family 4 protein [Patescibacteria group bacterium]